MVANRRSQSQPNGDTIPLRHQEVHTNGVRPTCDIFELLINTNKVLSGIVLAVLLIHLRTPLPPAPTYHSGRTISSLSMIPLDQTISTPVAASPIPLTTEESMKVGTSRSYRNIALGKPAKQSTTDDLRRGASQAVDGIRSSGFQLTLPPKDNTHCIPWWEVDLEREYDVAYIFLFNRMDCCQNALNNIRLDILNVNESGEWAVVGHWHQFEAVQSVAGFKFDPPIRGRRVRVRLDYCGTLHMAEVEVYGNE